MRRGWLRASDLIASTLIFVAFLPGALPQTAPATGKSVPPAFEAAGYVFVSGQGPEGRNGLPDKFADQVRQTLDNVKNALETSGLTMDHVVYVQVYLEDVRQLRELDEVFANYFLKDPPARAVLGVAKVPQKAIQMNAIAVRDLQGK